MPKALCLSLCQFTDTDLRSFIFSLFCFFLYCLSGMISAPWSRPRHHSMRFFKLGNPKGRNPLGGGERGSPVRDGVFSLAIGFPDRRLCFACRGPSHPTACGCGLKASSAQCPTGLSGEAGPRGPGSRQGYQIGSTEPTHF